MRTIAIFNQKGGVAKTTSCLNLGAALTLLGRRVLLIDIDPQGSLTRYFSGIDLSEHATVYEVMTGAVPIRKAVIPGKYDLIPLDLRMAGAEAELTGKEDALRSALQEIAKDYDYCLIDCGPNLSVFSIIALTAANDAIVPVAAEYMALDGLALLTDTVDLVQKTTNPGLTISGVIVTLYDVRRRQDRDCEAAIREYFPQTFEDVIKRNSKTAEAPGAGMDIFEYDPKNPAAAAYMNIAKKIDQK